MTARDDAIEAAGRYVLLHSPMSWLDARAFGAAIVDEVEPLLRADERERNREAEGVEAYLITEHAEAVAARLVEVICEQESLIVWNIRWREQAEAAEAYYQDSYDQWIAADTARLNDLWVIRRERDNLRAQIAADIEDDRDVCCKRGHEFTEENTYVNGGKRHCRACKIARKEARRG